MTSTPTSRIVGALALLLLLLVPAAGPAQSAGPARRVSHNSAAWFAYTGTHPVSPTLRVLLEGQVRRVGPLADPQAWLLRTALIRTLGQNASVGGGYLHQVSYRYGLGSELAPTHEHRAFQQLELRQRTGPLALSHRYRMEQRWIERLQAEGDEVRRAGWTYTNRARYQLRATAAPGGGAAEDGEPYLTAYDEPFVSFGRNVRGNVFDQNRAFAGAGYRWSRALRLEIGYLHNYVLRSSGREAESNSTLLVTVFSEAPLFP